MTSSMDIALRLLGDFFQFFFFSRFHHRMKNDVEQQTSRLHNKKFVFEKGKNFVWLKKFEPQAIVAARVSLDCSPSNINYDIAERHVN